MYLQYGIQKVENEIPKNNPSARYVKIMHNTLYSSTFVTTIIVNLTKLPLQLLYSIQFISNN